MKTLYIEWKNPTKKTWSPVGLLTRSKGQYTFQYTKGAYRAEGFTPFGRMSSLDGIYSSEELFPLFENRLLNKSRPEYRSFMNWLNLEEDADPMDVLAVSQGLRVTDSLRIYSPPSKSKDGYSYNFFAAGISHLAKESVERIANLSKGDRIYLMDDIQNEFHDALTLRTDEPKALAGYCPSFLSAPIKKLIEEDKTSVKVCTTKVNVDAPTRYRLLCTLKISKMDLGNFIIGDDHQTVSDQELEYGDFSSAATG